MKQTVLPHRHDHIFQINVIVDDLTTAFSLSPLATTYNLQHGFQTAVKSSQVWF